MPDALRLAIGTFTRLPVAPPRGLTQRTAGWAMSIAPVVGIALALVCGLPLLLDSAATTALLLAALSIALLAFTTRALHLDGLADTADALGSAKPAPMALEIARRSDIGPFGVVAISLDLLLQTLALAACVELGKGLGAMVIAVAVGRIAITWACTAQWPAARAEGLGATVAGSVPLAVPIGWALISAAGSYALLGIAGVVAVLLALCAGQALLLLTRRRLGGITGDVLGALVESTTTVALVLLALLLPYWG